MADEDLETSEHVLEDQDTTEYEDDIELVIVKDDDGDAVGLPGLDIQSARPPGDNLQQCTLLKPPSTTLPPATSRSTRHAEAKTSSPSISTSNARLEKLPKSRKLYAASAPTRKQQVCPICSKAFDSDNVALNEHIDFCLSRGAILAATAVSHSLSPTSKPNRQTK